MAEVPRKPARTTQPPPSPSDLPGELEPAWDDDTTPRFELDDPMAESAFDRVTAIPELPSELLAKQMMSEPQAFAPGAPDASLLQTLVPPSEQQSPERLEPTGLELMDVSAGPVTPHRAAAAEPARDPRDPSLELDLSEMADGGALPAPAPAPPGGRDAMIREMKDRYAMGDFTGALVVAEGMLEQNLDDLDAQRYAQSCRDVLTQMYTARLGALSQRVRVAVPGDQIRWLSLDHRAGFVLSLIDGSSTVEELLDISGMNRLDALRIIYTLFEQRVIALG